MIFGNPITEKVQRRAIAKKRSYIKKFGDDSEVVYPLSVTDNSVLTPALGVRSIENSPEGGKLDAEKGIVLGNIRMGYGHYRIAMAIASAAKHLGYTPYWFDLSSYSETTGTKVITHLNSLYSLGSRISQKSKLFNHFYWEPLNRDGFRKLNYNAVDQKVAELMTPIFGQLPKSLPFIGTHTWAAQAAVHAGMESVVNIIPDNWPMALHLAEGSIHTVQTPSSYMGYKTLNGMDGHRVLKPMPASSLANVGHYVDHELLADLDKDCDLRLERLKHNRAKRLLFTIGGAGAQYEMYRDILKHYSGAIERGELIVYINVGDHISIKQQLLHELPELARIIHQYDDDWQKTQDFAQQAIFGQVPKGVHLFYHQDIFAAVYATNLLMRSCDILVTKPSELAFYPVPKLLIKRVGGHEAYGATRSAEIGDGTLECETSESILAMLALMLSDPSVLTQMNQAIVDGKRAGVYDGAYRAVELAVVPNKVETAKASVEV